MGDFFLYGTTIPEPPDRLRPRAGALVSFVGVVRNHHEGKDVKSLDYEIYEEMALAEGRRILAEARQHFPLEDAWAAHRYGSLAVGDAAVAVHVWTPHRREGFAACAWIIDEIKDRLPVWKHEFYADGTIAWVACHHAGASQQVGSP